MVFTWGGGELFVVSAPSGTGKTTLCREACRRLDGLVYSVSHTTRPPREGEVQGRDYYFVDDRAFQGMVDREEFLEWAQIYEHRYGTSRTWIQEQLAQGLDVILDVDVQGAAKLRKTDLPCHYIFVLPPSWDVLKERLSARGTELLGQIRGRLLWARDELIQWVHYDFIIVNEDLQEAAKDLEGLIRTQRCHIQRRGKWIQQRIGQWIPSEG